MFFLMLKIGKSVRIELFNKIFWIYVNDNYVHRN